jgi:AcrR family transcriptional regulator
VRVRTEAKRDAILDVAAEVFMETGYERASMSEIAARLGGSKATLYSYFPSKEELFHAVVQHMVGAQVEPAFTELPSLADQEPRALLVRLGERVLTAVLMPEAIAARRMVIAESAASQIGARFWKFGPQQALDALTAYVGAATKAGRLKATNPQVAAQQLMALYSAELDWRWLFGLQDRFTRQQIKQSVAHAVDLFMAQYGAERK